MLRMNSLRLIFFVLFFNSAILCCDASTSRVLIVENLASPGSIKIAHYYFLKRRLPAANLCTITCPATEQCSTADVVRMIIEPIRQCIHQRKLKIDYIVLTKGIPIEFNDSSWSGFSIDSVLTTMDNPLPSHALNPYFAATDRFSQHEYGIYLVTRLDGWSVDDCLRLVDHGLATHPGPGPIYLHPAPNRDVDGYYETNQTIRIAAADLAQSDVKIFFDQSDTFHSIPGIERCALRQ